MDLPDLPPGPPKPQTLEDHVLIEKGRDRRSRAKSRGWNASPRGRNSARNDDARTMGHKVASGNPSEGDGEVAAALPAPSECDCHVGKEGERAARATICSGLSDGVQGPHHTHDRADCGAPTSRRDGARLDATAPRPAFELIRADRLEIREPDYMVDGLLERGSLAQVFGPPGSTKSFAAIGIACCVATGTPFHGREVKAGAVIFIAGEGQSGLRRRTAAWELLNGRSLAEAPLYFSKVAAQLLDGSSAKAVAEAVDRIAAEIGAVALIVVDTLARNFGPGDENQTADMGAFIAAIDALKARYGAAALVVHHSGHADKTRGRGNSANFGALDHEYRVEKDGEAVVITCTKMKEGSEPDPMGFKLVQVDLGLVDSKGHAVTSAAYEACDAPKAAAARPMSPALERGLRSFDIALDRLGLTLDLTASVHVEDWRPVFYELSTSDTPESKKKAFQRIRTELVARGDLAVADDRYRLAKHRGNEDAE